MTDTPAIGVNRAGIFEQAGLDINRIPPVNADLLETMMNKQRLLMSQYHVIEYRNNAPVVGLSDLGDLDARHVQARLKHLAWCITEELGEAMNELKNKPWKVTERPTDREAYFKELADIGHFFFELLITSGLDAETYFLHYFNAAAENDRRIEDGV